MSFSHFKIFRNSRDKGNLFRARKTIHYNTGKSSSTAFKPTDDDRHIFLTRCHSLDLFYRPVGDLLINYCRGYTTNQPTNQPAGRMIRSSWPRCRFLFYHIDLPPSLSLSPVISHFLPALGTRNQSQKESRLQRGNPKVT